MEIAPSYVAGAMLRGDQRRRPIPARNELLEGPLSEAQRIKLQSSTEERGALRLSDLSLRFACRACESNGNCAVTRALQGICHRSYAPWRPTTQTYPSEHFAQHHLCGRPPNSNPWNRGFLYKENPALDARIIFILELLRINSLLSGYYHK